MSARPLPRNKPIELREADFYRLVKTYSKYPADLLEAFYSYWSEKNKSGSKMRFELEKTWDTGRRLGTWDRNNFGSKAGPKEQGKLIHLMAPKQDPKATTDIERLDQLLNLYAARPTKYTIDTLSKNWPSEALINCYKAIKDNKLWDPRITKQDLEGLEERRLKATVIIRTLDYYGTKGYSFSHTLEIRNKLK